MMPLIEYLNSVCTRCFAYYGKCEPSIKKPCPDSARSHRQRNDEDLELAKKIRQFEGDIVSANKHSERIKR